MTTNNRADATTQDTTPARVPHIVTPESLIRPRDACDDAFIFRDPAPRNKEVAWEKVRGLLAILSWRRPFDSAGEEIFARTYLDTITGMTQDDFKNRHMTIPYADGTPCNVVWSSHIDTCHNAEGYQRLAICKDENDLAYVRTRRGEGNCLGADDGTGVWLMLEMIRAQRPGRYIFHRGEERGCQGSRWIANSAPHLLDGATAAIALDRRDFNNIITHQGGERGCSEAFAASIAAQLPGFKADDTGLFTDTKQYFRKIPECTNLSVGYQSQHGPLERQYLDFAVSMRDALIAFDPARLVIQRDPTRYEYKGYNGGNSNYSGGNTMRARYKTGSDPNESGNDPGNINPAHYIHRASGGNTEMYVWSKKTSRNILRATAVFVIGDGFVTFDAAEPSHVRARAAESAHARHDSATVTRRPSTSDTTPAAEDKDDSISPDNELFDLQLEIDLERDIGALCFAYPTAAAKLLEAAGISQDDMLQMVYGDYLDDADNLDPTEDEDDDTTAEQAGPATQADAEPHRCVTIIDKDGKAVRVTAAEAMRLIDERRAAEKDEREQIADGAPPMPELERARLVANSLVQDVATPPDDATAESEALARAFTPHTH